MLKNIIQSRGLRPLGIIILFCTFFEFKPLLFALRFLFLNLVHCCVSESFFAWVVYMMAEYLNPSWSLINFGFNSYSCKVTGKCRWWCVTFKRRGLSWRGAVCLDGHHSRERLTSLFSFLLHRALPDLHFLKATGNINYDPKVYLRGSL